MRVIISEAAWSDLYRIGAAIAQEAVSAASFIEELYDRCHELHHMAYLYPILPHRTESEVRRRVYRRYLIFYRIEGDTVQILHILHGAMDYEAVLFPDD